MSFTDRIATKVAALLKPELQQLHKHIDDNTAALHIHLEAATSTLTENDDPPGKLTTTDREGLHAIRAKLGARYNPPPDESLEERRRRTGQNATHADETP